MVKSEKIPQKPDQSQKVENKIESLIARGTLIFEMIQCKL